MKIQTENTGMKKSILSYCGSLNLSAKIIFIFSFILFVSCMKEKTEYTDENAIKDHEFINTAPYQTIKVTDPDGSKVKNIILLIGDGMGLTQVSTAWVSNGGKLNLDNFTHTGLMRTYAANRLITDSGAGGTALATGQKANYHSVGVDTLGNAIPSLTDFAVANQMGAGILVTCGLTDATPATFCASNPERDSLENIALDYLNVNAHYILGGSRKHFNQRKDGRNLLEEMKQKDYQVTQSWEETKQIAEGKVFAVLEDSQLPLADERGDMFQEATIHAINLLDQHENGFFAMIEGSRIDDCGHWHDLPALMNEIYDFDQTIGRVLQWAEKDGETLVIVLADHETGGLSLIDGNIKENKVKTRFSTGDHSDILVPVYAWGPESHLFTGIYENTNIFHKIHQIMSLNLETKISK